MVDSSKGTALITGASSGIGAVYADRLAKRDFDLILVARSGERLKALAQKLTQETGRKIDYIVADLNDRQALKSVETVLQQDASITMLINNAGFGSTAPLLKADVDKMDDMIELNVSALTRLTYAAVPSFVARGGGTVVNVASVVAVMPEGLNGVYGATKAFVLAFSQSLHHELADKGVRVQVVLPGGTATEFWDVAGTPIENLPKDRQDKMMSTGDMVDAALTGLDQGEFVTIPPLQDAAYWEKFEAARLALRPGLLGAAPAKRYKLDARIAA